MTGRVVAFDLGDRRIGVAVSDPGRIIAEGRDTLLREGEAIPWRAVLGVLEAAEAARVVVGDPVHLDGSVGERSQLCRAFARELEERSGVPVDLQDERLTSVQARRTLIETRPGGGRKKKKANRKEDVDRVAAVLILQAWLDGQGGAA